MVSKRILVGVAPTKVNKELIRQFDVAHYDLIEKSKGYENFWYLLVDTDGVIKYTTVHLDYHEKRYERVYICSYKLSALLLIKDSPDMVKEYISGC